jgi:formylglycine-generating enzyme required for sulfatase activity
LVEPASIISHGLINSRHNLEVDMVEVFATDGLIKVGELHTGAFPRAVAGDRERIVVAASDAPRAARSSGFAISYDATTLKPLATYRLLGSPTGCAALNAEGEFYVAIDNPYDLRERFSDRQDLQIVRLDRESEKVPDRAGAVSTQPPPALSPSIQPAQIAVALPGGVVMEMVWIPPGSFMMGSPQEEARMMPAEGPRHEVTISRGFYLGKCELTQAQWEAVMGTRPWVGRSYAKAHPDHPAVYISWDDVQALIQRLNEWEGRNLYRMPTEAEWEYACRAGTSTRWSFGNQTGLLGDYAWFQDNTWSAGEPYAHPVGLLLPNPWGLYDMHGNVWEWVQDWLGDYSAEPQIDPQGPPSGRYRVVRSGIFMAPPMGQRSAFRYAGNQDFPDGGVGVRLVRQAP